VELETLRGIASYRHSLLRRIVLAGAILVGTSWAMAVTSLLVIEWLAGWPTVAILIGPLVCFLVVFVVVDSRRPKLPDPAAWRCRHARLVHAVVSRDTGISGTLLPLVAVNVILVSSYFTGKYSVFEHLVRLIGHTGVALATMTLAGASYVSWRRMFSRVRSELHDETDPSPRKAGGARQ
jgi:hypothetical protein